MVLDKRYFDAYRPGSEKYSCLNWPAMAAAPNRQNAFRQWPFDEANGNMAGQ